MNRMDFFEKVILGGSEMLLINKSFTAERQERQKVTLAELYIAAFQYYDGPDIADLLEDGLMLRLNREPSNRWDPLAVEVYAGDAKLGYIPQSDSTTIARLMDSGTWVKARIITLNPDEFPRRSVKIEVFYERDFSLS